MAATAEVWDMIISYESGELDADEITSLMQHLIDSGVAWQLQGSYGRLCAKMLMTGLCSWTPEAQTAFKTQHPMLYIETDHDYDDAANSLYAVEEVEADV